MVEGSLVGEENLQNKQHKHIAVFPFWLCRVPLFILANVNNNSLPFNKYAYLTTHNAFAIDGEPSQTGVPQVTITNQEDSITHQLSEPAIGTLKEIEAFLSANPSEIVTLILEDYIHTQNGLKKVFSVVGLKKFWFPVTNMPRNGGNWSLVSDMVAKNRRLIVFTSVKSKEQSEGIAYQWNYMVENQYGDGGRKTDNSASLIDMLQT
nr:PI-PLC X domain-containing protein At5g67130-like isoform X2 [Arachis hypogaea]